MKMLVNQGKMILAAALFLSFTVACGNERTNNTQAETEAVEGVSEIQQEQVDAQAGEVEPFLADYIQVKKALVQDNYEEVKNASLELLNSVTKSESGEILNENVQAIANAADIAGQRQAFAALSQQLYELAQEKELTSKTLYWQHCPMAMNNQGANWLSLEKQVQNPYMGQRMPSCGSVQETLNN